MFDKRRGSHDAGRPSLPTVHSEDRLPLQSAGAVAGKLKNTASLRRKNTGKPSTLGRSDTLKSKPPLTRVPSVQTRYMEMLLHLDEIPRIHNIAVSLFTWIILAGFLVVPGTFTSFKNSEAFQNANSDKDDIAHEIVHSIANIGLLYLSAGFCAVGTLGCLWTWFRWRHNYVWLINRIFLPVTLNSIAGLITTLVNVYTAQKGVWSVTAKITAIVTGSCVGVAGFLFVVYNFWALRRIRKSHEAAFGLEHEHENETIVEKVKRKAQEAPLQSGSMV